MVPHVLVYPISQFVGFLNSPVYPRYSYKTYIRARSRYHPRSRTQHLPAVHPAMKNVKRRVQCHCVASNVKPHSPPSLTLSLSSSLSLSLPLSPTQSSRITHGTSLGNECDKHVSVTGPPAAGPGPPSGT